MDTEKLNELMEAHTEVEQKMLDNIEWLKNKKYPAKIYQLDRNYIVEYADSGPIPQRWFKIFDMNGSDIYHESFQYFNQCLLIIALDVKINDTGIVRYLLK